MDDTQRHKLHKELLDKIHKTYVEKNEAYGNSFDRSIDRWGYTAALVRIEDKCNRLEQLLLHNKACNDESAIDTALDLANYSLMIAMKLLALDDSPNQTAKFYFIDGVPSRVT